MEPRRYRSKVDTWVVILFGATIAFVAWAIFSEWKAGQESLLFVLIPLALGAGLPIWTLLGTHYTLDDATLKVRSGPLRWTVPLKGISKVEQTRTLASSPALSLDRIAITYDRFSQVVISPHDREAFLSDLEHRRQAAA
jgi:hypothetical protein